MEYELLLKSVIVQTLADIFDVCNAKLDVEKNRPIASYIIQGEKIFEKYAQYDAILDEKLANNSRYIEAIKYRIDDFNNIFKELKNDYAFALVPHRSLYEKEVWDGAKYITIEDESINKNLLVKNALSITRCSKTPFYKQKKGDHGNMFALEELVDALVEAKNIFYKQVENVATMMIRNPWILESLHIRDDITSSRKNHQYGSDSPDVYNVPVAVRKTITEKPIEDNVLNPRAYGSKNVKQDIPQSIMDRMIF